MPPPTGDWAEYTPKPTKKNKNSQSKNKNNKSKKEAKAQEVAANAFAAVADDAATKIWDPEHEAATEGVNDVTGMRGEGGGDVEAATNDVGGFNFGENNATAATADGDGGGVVDRAVEQDTPVHGSGEVVMEDVDIDLDATGNTFDDVATSTPGADAFAVGLDQSTPVRRGTKSMFQDMIPNLEATDNFSNNLPTSTPDVFNRAPAAPMPVWGRDKAKSDFWSSVDDEPVVATPSKLEVEDVKSPPMSKSQKKAEKKRREAERLAVEQAVEEEVVEQQQFGEENVEEEAAVKQVDEDKVFAQEYDGQPDAEEQQVGGEVQFEEGKFKEQQFEDHALPEADEPIRAGADNLAEEQKLAEEYRLAEEARLAKEQKLADQQKVAEQLAAYQKAVQEKETEAKQLTLEQQELARQKAVIDSAAAKKIAEHKAVSKKLFPDQNAATPKATEESKVITQQKTSAPIKPTIDSTTRKGKEPAKRQSPDLKAATQEKVIPRQHATATTKPVLGSASASQPTATQKLAETRAAQQRAAQIAAEERRVKAMATEMATRIQKEVDEKGASQKTIPRQKAAATMETALASTSSSQRTEFQKTANEKRMTEQTAAEHRRVEALAAEIKAQMKKEAEEKATQKLIAQLQLEEAAELEARRKLARIQQETAAVRRQNEILKAERDLEAAKKALADTKAKTVTEVKGMSRAVPPRPVVSGHGQANFIAPPARAPVLNPRGTVRPAGIPASFRPISPGTVEPRLVNGRRQLVRVGDPRPTNNSIQTVKLIVNGNIPNALTIPNHCLSPRATSLVQSPSCTSPMHNIGPYLPFTGTQYTLKAVREYATWLQTRSFANTPLSATSLLDTRDPTKRTSLMDHLTRCWIVGQTIFDSGFRNGVMGLMRHVAGPCEFDARALLETIVVVYTYTAKESQLRRFFAEMMAFIMGGGGEKRVEELSGVSEEFLSDVSVAMVKYRPTGLKSEWARRVAEDQFRD